VSAVQTPSPIDKRALVGLSRSLEREAFTTPPKQMAAALQDGRFFTERTRAAYVGLAARGCRVTLYGRGLHAALAPGVTGVSLDDDDDPLLDEWAIVVPSTEPVVLAAVDLRSDVQDLERRFLYAVSRDPEVVIECARLLGGAPRESAQAG
jgi:hypothetical protein